MTASSIIKEQFKHINSNFREYLLIALPLIVAQVLLLQGIALFNDLNIALYATVIFSLIVIIYYYFRFAVNLHRLIILKENSNYYSPLKHKKVTLFYFLSLLIYFIVIFVIIIAIAFLDGLLNANYLILNWLYVIALGISAYIYSIYGFLLPEVAIGNKFSLKSSRHKSKGYRKILFYQFLILYVPFWIADRIIVMIVPETANLAFNLIYSIISIYILILFIGSLSRTYMIAKEQNERN